MLVSIFSQCEENIDKNGLDYWTVSLSPVTQEMKWKQRSNTSRIRTKGFKSFYISYCDGIRKVLKNTRFTRPWSSPQDFHLGNLQYLQYKVSYMQNECIHIECWCYLRKTAKSTPPLYFLDKFTDKKMKKRKKSWSSIKCLP